MDRRTFLGGAASAALSAQTRALPNIVWLTCEDIGPHLGVYGDKYAVTPNLDAFAARSVFYTRAWSNAPVCAPARTTIISGLYPPSTGAEHMRSRTRLPAAMKMYPQYLRESGYYCTNNSKEDYNVQKPGEVWDESSNKAHWRNRKPGQPFFAVFNFVITHESQIRKRPHVWKHDPAEARIPAYHPDTPEVREDWAQYYDNITTMDGMAAKVLADLKSDGLADDTIVFFYGDHGSGMPRNKRWPYNSGLQVPFIVHIPKKHQGLAPRDYVPGGKSARPVSFVDLAPTLLSLAGVKPPEHFQGHAFLGKYPAAEQPFLYGFRGRMDERYDLVRSIRDVRYVYIRNYMPHKIYGQHISYMFETPTTRKWKQLYDGGKLNAAQRIFWETKQPEELYDLERDRDEVNNLAKSPAHRDILKRLRTAQRDLVLKIRDIGFLPEDEIHSRSAGSSPYEMGHDKSKYPLERILATAELASSLDGGGLDDRALPELTKALDDSDSAVRYWGALGFRMRRKAPPVKALEDSSPSVRAIAAEAFGLSGNAAETAKALSVLLDLAVLGRNSVYVSMLALNALNALGPRAKPAEERIRALPTEHPSAPDPMGGYIPRLIEKILEDLR